MTRGKTSSYDTSHERAFIQSFVDPRHADRAMSLLNSPRRRHDLVNSIIAPLRKNCCSIIEFGQLHKMLKRACPDMESRTCYIIAQYDRLDQSSHPVTSFIHPTEDFFWKEKNVMDAFIVSIIPGELAVRVHDELSDHETWLCVKRKKA